MARAMELLRATWPGLQRADVDGWVGWARARLLPNIDYFVNVLSAYPPGFDTRKLLYGGWGRPV